MISQAYDANSIRSPAFVAKRLTFGAPANVRFGSNLVTIGLGGKLTLTGIPSICDCIHPLSWPRRKVSRVGFDPSEHAHCGGRLAKLALHGWKHGTGRPYVARRRYRHADGSDLYSRPGCRP